MLLLLNLKYDTVIGLFVTMDSNCSYPIQKQELGDQSKKKKKGENIHFTHLKNGV